MPTSCFDSKQKFINALRQAFQGGTFSLFPSCTNKDVMEYYQYLKRDFEAGDQQHCNLMVHVGLQRDGYWCLSEEVCLNLQSYGAIFTHGMMKTFNIFGPIFYYYQIIFLFINAVKCNLTELTTSSCVPWWSAAWTHTYVLEFHVLVDCSKNVHSGCLFCHC